MTAMLMKAIIESIIPVFTLNQGAD